MVKPTTIDEYLATLNNDTRTALQDLRDIIRAVVPQAEECISYQLPAFRLDGKLLVGFGATQNHCALYLMSSSTLETYKEELRDYQTSKGAIRSQPDHPIPTSLVRKLIKARIRENAAQQSVRKKNTKRQH